MAIAFGDTTANSSGAANPFNATSVSVAGSNTCGLVGIQALNGDVVTAVTWNGTAMSLVDKQNRGDGRFDYLYLLIAPSAGATTIAVSNGGGNIKLRSVYYTGCKQSSQPDVSNKTTVSGASSASLSFITTVNNDWLISTTDTSSGTLVAGSNTTQRGIIDDLTFFDSNSDQTPAGSHSLNWTGTGLTGGIIGAALAPAGAAVAAANFLSLLGVGA